MVRCSVDLMCTLEFNILITRPLLLKAGKYCFVLSSIRVRLSVRLWVYWSVVRPTKWSDLLEA